MRKTTMDYINGYVKDHYDRITILRKRGEKTRLKELAKKEGYASLSEFINIAIDEKISKRKETCGHDAARLIKKIDRAIEEKALKFGIMGTEQCTVELPVTEKEKEIFYNIEKYGASNYDWSMGENTLYISYTEEVIE